MAGTMSIVALQLARYTAAVQTMVSRGPQLTEYGVRLQQRTQLYFKHQGQSHRRLFSPIDRDFISSFSFNNT